MYAPKPIAVLLIIMSLNIQAWTIKVENETPYDLAIAMYYVDADTQAAASSGLTTVFMAVSAGVVGERIGDEIKKLRENKMHGFVKHLKGKHTGKERHTTLEADGKKSIKWNIGTGCIRVVKAWIVEKKTITAQEANAMKKFDSNSTLGSVIKDLKESKKWNNAVKQNKDLTYHVYNPALGDAHSWSAKRVPFAENQCSDHDFKIYVQKNNKGTQQLKIDLK